MSHGPSHDPTPTPTSKPDESELEVMGLFYVAGFDNGHSDGFKRAQQLKAHFVAADAAGGGGKAEAAKAAAAVPAIQAELDGSHPYDGTPERSGCRDGYPIGFLRGIHALWLEKPTPQRLAVKEAVSTAFQA